MKEKKEKRFVHTSREGSAFDVQKDVFVDRETGVHYLLVRSDHGIAVTPLLGADGTPVVRKISGHGEE